MLRLTTPKPLNVWITINCEKFFKRWDYQTTLPAYWEICMQVKKQQSELDWSQQWTGTRLGKEYIKAVYCHPVWKWKWKWSRSVMSNSLRPRGLPGSSVHGILQARILLWVAILFSRGSFWIRDQTLVSCTAGRFFTIWATREDIIINRLWIWLKPNSTEFSIVVEEKNRELRYMYNQTVVVYIPRDFCKWYIYTSKFS